MTRTYPTDYAWSTFTLEDLEDWTTHLTVFVPEAGDWDEDYWDVDGWEGASWRITSGTAESPNIDCGATEVAYLMTWIGGGRKNERVTIQWKTATTEAGLASASYATAKNGVTIPLADRKRWIKILITLTIASEDGYVAWPLTEFSIVTAPEQTQRSSYPVGLNWAAKGSRPTRDRVFEGRKYQCGICGGTYRRKDLVRQRGVFVCKDTCQDDNDNKRSDIQKRGH